MDVLVTLAGGLAFFLYGMSVLSGGLERAAGGRLERMLKRMTASRLKRLLLGAAITAAIQSSSAVTVMLVGLVNSGILTIGQSIGVIMGSNIGTTVTAWVLALAGVDSNRLWFRLLKAENLSLLLAAAGVLLMGSRSPRRADAGKILAGLAVLMYGMKLMSGAVEPLSGSPAFARLLTAFQNPVLGLLAGLVIAAVLQSSSASVGVLQALAATGTVTYGAAIPIVMGQNIGTCVTALLSSVGVSRSAKKVAAVHVAFNITGAAAGLTLYCAADAVFPLPFAPRPIDAVGVALVHTAFNLFTTAILLPFAGLMERRADSAPPETRDGPRAELLDRRLLNTPSVAISECDALASKMAVAAVDTVTRAMGLLERCDEKQIERVLETEKYLDRCEDELGTCLVLLSSKRLSEPDSLKVSKMLHVIGDFERLGDHAVNILRTAQELHQKGLRFSDTARKELSVLTRAIREILELSRAACQTGDLALAMQVEPLEQTIDRLVNTLKRRHIQRLQSGACSIGLGFLFSDALNDLERISDHCSNIAVAVIELSHSSFDTHRYLGSVRTESETYQAAFQHYSKKYAP